MNVVTVGLLCRILGLLVEMLGILGISILSTRGASALPSFLGPDPDRVLKWMVISGFMIWLIGRVLLYSARPRAHDLERRESPEGRGRNDLRL